MEQIMGNFYQDLIKNKNDIKFIESLSGKKAIQFDNLIRDEEHFDLLMSSLSHHSLEKMPKISRKVFAKYLVMHYFSNRGSLTIPDLSYLSKIVGLYFCKSKKNECLLNLNFSLNQDEQAGRIHLVCYTLYRQEYYKITKYNNSNDAIRHIKKCFANSYKTKNIAENLDPIIINNLKVLKRDLFFEKFYCGK